MKSSLSIFFLLIIYNLSFSQSSSNQSEISKLFANSISSIDSVPDYKAKKKPFKLTGTLYLEDGVTPAANHIITINQADENGDYVFTKDGKNKILRHRAVVKTDVNGSYTFYTFVPGGDRLYNQLQEIYMKVETPEGNTYALPTLFFDDDPFLSKRCKNRLTKKGQGDRILQFQSKDNMAIATKEVILETTMPLN